MRKLQLALDQNKKIKKATLEMEIVTKIITTVISSVLAFLLGLLWTRYSALKNQKKQQQNEKDAEYEAIKQTCKLSLRSSLKADYEFFVLKQGWCSIEDKNDVEEEYRLYHTGFNGNGRGTRYYNAIMELPESPPEEE